MRLKSKPGCWLLERGISNLPVPPMGANSFRIHTLIWNSGHKLWVFWQNTWRRHKLLLKNISTWNTVKCKSRRKRRTEKERVENKWFCESWYEPVVVLNSSWSMCFLFCSPYREGGSRLEDVPFTHTHWQASTKTDHAFSAHAAFGLHQTHSEEGGSFRGQIYHLHFRKTDQIHIKRRAFFKHPLISRRLNRPIV